MDQIFIRDLIAHGIIGVNADERENPQDIQINIVLYVDLGRAGESDDLNDSVSYSAVAEKVIAEAEAARRFTVEALASDIARLCLQEVGVKKVRVRVEKPGAVPRARSVGVEIVRRADRGCGK